MFGSPGGPAGDSSAGLTGSQDPGWSAVNDFESEMQLQPTPRVCRPPHAAGECMVQTHWGPAIRSTFVCLDCRAFLCPGCEELTHLHAERRLHSCLPLAVFDRVQKLFLSRRDQPLAQNSNESNPNQAKQPRNLWNEHRAALPTLRELQHGLADPAFLSDLPAQPSGNSHALGSAFSDPQASSVESKSQNNNSHSINHNQEPNAAKTALGDEAPLESVVDPSRDALHIPIPAQTAPDQQRLLHRNQLRQIAGMCERVVELKAREFGLHYRIPFREFVHELASLLSQNSLRKHQSRHQLLANSMDEVAVLYRNVEVENFQRMGRCGRLMYDLDMRTRAAGGSHVFGFSQHAFRRTIQVVNARFGVTVAAYFQIARWMFLLNVGVSLLFLAFLLLPFWLSVARERWDAWGDGLEGLALGEGLEDSWLFYGAFAANYGDYEMDSAWTFCVGAALLLPFVFTLVAAGSMRSADQHDKAFMFSKLVFASYDHTVQHRKAARLMRRALWRSLEDAAADHFQRFQRQLHKSQQRTPDWKRLRLRFLGMALTLCLGAASATACWLLLRLDQDVLVRDHRSWTRLLWAPLLLTLVKWAGPGIVRWIVAQEGYERGSTRFRQLFVRVMCLRMANVLAIIHALFSQETPYLSDCLEADIGSSLWRLVVFDWAWELLWLSVLWPVLRSIGLWSTYLCCPSRLRPRSHEHATTYSGGNTVSPTIATTTAMSANSAVEMAAMAGRNAQPLGNTGPDPGNRNNSNGNNRLRRRRNRTEQAEDKAQLRQRLRPPFRLAENILDLVYRQALIMVALPFSPAIPLLGAFLGGLGCWAKRFEVMNFRSSPELGVPASKQQKYFRRAMFLVYVVALIPFTIFLRREIHCGPHGEEDGTVLELLSRRIQAMPSFFIVALGYPSDPLLLWILFGILAIYLAFLKRRGRWLGQECERLSQQLKQETRSIQRLDKRAALSSEMVSSSAAVPVSGKAYVGRQLFEEWISSLGRLGSQFAELFRQTPAVGGDLYKLCSLSEEHVLQVLSGSDAAYGPKLAMQRAIHKKTAELFGLVAQQQQQHLQPQSLDHSHIAGGGPIGSNGALGGLNVSATHPHASSASSALPASSVTGPTASATRNRPRPHPPTTPGVPLRPLQPLQPLKPTNSMHSLQRGGGSGGAPLSRSHSMAIHDEHPSAVPQSGDYGHAPRSSVYPPAVVLSSLPSSGSLDGLALASGAVPGVPGVPGASSGVVPGAGGGVLAKDSHAVAATAEDAMVSPFAVDLPPAGAGHAFQAYQKQARTGRKPSGAGNAGGGHRGDP